MPAFTFGPKAAPPAPVVTARAKRMVIDITPSSDNERVSCEVRRYASATDAANDEQLITGIGGSPYLTGGGQYLRTPATYQKRWTNVVELRVTDHDDLTVGATYYYAVFETDEFGNRSLTSATDSDVYRLVDTDDIADAAVTDVELAPNAAIPSKILPRNFTNLVRDPEVYELSLWNIYASSGTVVAQKYSNASGAVGSSAYYMLISRTWSASDVIVRGGAEMPVEQGASYYFSVFAGVAASSGSPTVSAYIEWYGIDSGGNPTTLISTTTVLLFTGTSGNGSTVVTAPASAQVARWGVKMTAPETFQFFYMASPWFSRQMTATDYADGSVGEDALAADVYTRSRILGTVSQSGGTPTGAIIEHGSNSNGYYTKFADGTMICRFVDGGTLDSNTASGSGFVSSASGTWTFPAAFINTNDTVVTGQVNGLNRWVSFGAPGTTSVLYRHNSFVTSSSGVVTRLQAVGRWF